MNLAELRSAVRDQMDVDETDLPSARIDLYLREGFNRTLQMERNWPFLQKEWSFTTTSEDGVYSLSTIAADVREIQAIEFGGYSIGLQHIDHETASRIWVGDYDTPGSTEWFSVWGQQLYLWPRPDSAIDLVIRGIRTPEDWVTTGAAAEPDWDRVLDIPLIYFAVSRSYLQQEDDELAGVYDQLWKESAGAAASDIMRAPNTRPRIYNGGVRYPRSSRYNMVLP